jgi:glycosyltransferase involved in cell wall biosynthesis
MQSLSRPARDVKPLLIFVHGSAEMYGSDKVLLNLAEGAVVDGQLQPVVVLHEHGPLREALQRAGAEVHVAKVCKIHRSMLTAAAPFTLWHQLRRASADLDAVVAGRSVALVYSNTLAVLGGAVWARRRGYRHVWHVHEILLRPWIVRRGLPWLAERLSDSVISNSHQTESWLLQQAPRLRSRSVVIFNGLKPVVHPAASDIKAFRSLIGAEDSDLVVTVAGRLNHWKGQGLLIEALALLRDAGQLGCLRVAVVGDVFSGHDDIRGGLMAKTQGLGLEDKVRFVPFVDDIYTVWFASDIAVVPSLEPEPFGMVAIEAMACALPVVAAAHGGLLDIVAPQQTGLLFQPRNARALADSLLTLARDAPLRRRLGTAGAQRQRDLFSLQSQVERTRAVWRRLVNA